MLGRPRVGDATEMTNMKQAALAIGVSGLLAAGTATGQISLTQDFDSGSLNVAASTVAGNTVNLVGRNTWSVYPSDYRWVYFNASGVSGQTPTFNISSSDYLDGSFALQGHRYVYSYDQQNWNFFDNGTVSGGTYTFGNNGAFTQDDVYVAFGLPYEVWRTQQHTSSVAASPFTHATVSGNGGYVIGQSAGGVDDVGRIVPPQDLLAYQVTDAGFAPTGGAKRKIVLAAGNHSGENASNYVMEGLVDFLLSDDPRAAGLRRSAEFYVYPQVNPDGRYGGYYRSNPENPDADHNRYWNNPAGFTDISQLRDAMVTDTGGDVDMLFDFHGWWGPWNDGNFIFSTSSLAGHPFFQNLAALEPDIDQITSSGNSGMLRIWGSTASGLGADFAVTPEFGYHPGVMPDDLRDIGWSFALSIFGSIDIFDLPGDANFDGVVDLADFVILRNNFGDAGMGAGNGDFNDDGSVDLEDFVILRNYFGSGTGGGPGGAPSVVPEPATAGLVVFSLLALRRRRTIDQT